jgi:hypothetical protein
LFGQNKLFQITLFPPIDQNEMFGSFNDYTDVLQLVQVGKTMLAPDPPDPFCRRWADSRDP